MYSQLCSSKGINSRITLAPQRSATRTRTITGEYLFGYRQGGFRPKPQTKSPHVHQAYVISTQGESHLTARPVIWADTLARCMQTRRQQGPRKKNFPEGYAIPDQLT